MANLELSVVVPVCGAGKKFFKNAAGAVAFFRAQKISFELLFVLNGERFEKNHPTLQFARALQSLFPEVRVLIPPGVKGKGAAIRVGIVEALGDHVAYTDADFPYDLHFLREAMVMANQGVDFVSANRRHPESELLIPVSSLKQVVLREVLGRFFNFSVRCLFPIQSRDTQAGAKLMSRRLGLVLARRIRCDGFLFDLEIFLTTREFGWRHRELPVRLSATNEPSTVRLVREFFRTAISLAKIKYGHLSGVYSPVGLEKKNYATQRDPGFA